jgi:hypothetical protein
METARSNHAAAPFPVDPHDPFTDRVLLVGGEGKGDLPLASAEVFNPHDGSFTAASP